MFKDKKLLVIDLDGTLLDSQQKISVEDQKSIEKFVKYGHEIMIATGRLDHDIVAVEKLLGIQGKYRISLNGAGLIDQKNHLLEQKNIDPILAQEIFSYLFENCPRVEVATFWHRYFVEERPPEIIGEMVPGLIKISHQLKEKIGKEILPSVLLAVNFSEKKFDFAKIKSYLTENYKQNIDVFRTAPNALEIVAKDVSKGNALSKVMAKLNLKKENVYTIGDSESDLSMFRVSNQSFAMVKASENVKKQATKVVDSVSDCINKFLLLC